MGRGGGGENDDDVASSKWGDGNVFASSATSVARFVSFVRPPAFRLLRTPLATAIGAIRKTLIEPFGAGTAVTLHWPPRLRHRRRARDRERGPTAKVRESEGCDKRPSGN